MLGRTMYKTLIDAPILPPNSRFLEPGEPVFWDDWWWNLASRGWMLVDGSAVSVEGRFAERPQKTLLVYCRRIPPHAAAKLWVCETPPIDAGDLSIIGNRSNVEEYVERMNKEYSLPDDDEPHVAIPLCEYIESWL